MNVFARRPIHVSWMIALAGLGVFGGVVVAPLLRLDVITHISWLLVGGTLVLAACVYQRSVWVVSVIVGGALIGLWRGTVTTIAYESYQPLIGQTIALSGVVSEDVDRDTNGNITMRLMDVMYQQDKLPGKIWVSLTRTSAEIQRSDRVTIRGQLSDGFGTFPASMYRGTLEHVVRPQPGDIALHVRDWFAQAIRTAIAAPESSLGIGYLVGQRRSLPEDLDNALKIAGLTHIVVASGYNLTILVRLARRLFAKISKYIATLASASLIVSFIAVTGMSPSMSRAGLVAGLSLLAWYYGRKFHPLVLLSFAVAVTVMINPSYAWGDIGWQLSFAAFAGVMILAPLLQAFYFGPKKPGTIRQILGETIAATIMTMPILLLAFGYISNVAIIANLLILPLVPMAMLLTFIAGVGALSLPMLATFFGYPAQLLLSYMTYTASFLADMPWAKAEIEITPLIAVGVYAVLVCIIVYMWWRTRLNLRDTNLIE